MPVKLSDIVSVQRNRARLYIIKPHEQLYDGGLSCTGRSHNGNFLSRFYVGAEILDNHLLRVIAETHMIKTHRALRIRQLHWIWNGLLFLFFCKKFKDTLGSCRHGLDLIDNLSNLLNRLGKILYILDERLNIADSDGSLNSKKSSGNGNAGITHIAYKHHQRMHKSGKKLRFPSRLIEHIVSLIKDRDGFLFLVEGFNHQMSRKGFLHLTVDVAQILLLGAEMLLGKLHNHRHQSCGNGKNHQRY